MHIEDFKILVRNLDKKYNGLMFGKKHEVYTRSEDKLHNFKRAADTKQTTPEDALLGMMNKHIVSIYDMVDDLTLEGRMPLPLEHPLKVWDEKIGDAINYLKLLRALIEERYNEEAG